MGKYPVALINANYYYLIFVDGTTPFITIISLRGKDETSPKVKQYFTCLGTHGKQLQAIRVDHGKEFLNDYSTSHMYHLAFARSYVE